MKRFIKNFVKSWLMPSRPIEILQEALQKFEENKIVTSMPYLQNNLQFKDKHKNQRCFILCCGPSISKQDLTLLKDETCISVSSFYLHKDYDIVRPKYHCLPDVLVSHEKYIPEEYAIRWFKEIDHRIKEASLFLACSGKDRELIQDHNLFLSRDVNYYFVNSNSHKLDMTEIDFSRTISPPASVSVLALQIAIYMGFKDIYLLGCDHDYLLHMYKSRHFYAENESILTSNPDYSEWKDSSFGLELNSQANLWNQYKEALGYAQSKHINIWNSTNGGLLDVFPRIRYENLF